MKASLERVYQQERFYQVGVPCQREGIHHLIDFFLGPNFRLIRGRLTREEAMKFLENTRKVPGQKSAVIRHIFSNA